MWGHREWTMRMGFEELKNSSSEAEAPPIGGGRGHGQHLMPYCLRQFPVLVLVVREPERNDAVQPFSADHVGSLPQSHEHRKHEGVRVAPRPTHWCFRWSGRAVDR